MRLFNNLYANSISVLTAEKIAKESIAQLQENLVVANMCNRDYDDEVADWGDTVKYNVTGEGTARRHQEGNALTVDAVSSTGGQIKLDQQLTSTFRITDAEQQRSWPDLIEKFIEPSARAIAEKMDRVVSGELYQFLSNTAGTLGTDITYADMVAANTVMNRNKLPLANRPMAVGPSGQGALLTEGKLVENQTAGDGSPILNGWIGRASGFGVGMSQTMPEIDASDCRTGAINYAAGYAKGTTTVIVDGFTGTGTDGAWCTIAGVPYRCSAVTEAASDVTGLVIDGGLREAVADDAVVVLYNLVSGIDVDGAQDANYSGVITYDNATIDPQVGQGVTFGNVATPYGIIAVDTTNKTIELNRPLEAAIADNATINLIPSGNYNWAFTPNALALVTRPMALPAAGNVDAFLAAYDNIAIRVMMSYEHLYQRTLVSLDVLCGVKTQDANRGVVLLG